MSAIITRLPTAAASYLRVVRRGRSWVVELVTPIEGGRPLVTKLASSASKVAAVDNAKQAGGAMHRPVVLPRGLCGRGS